jgi:hypothetical protein
MPPWLFLNFLPSKQRALVGSLLNHAIAAGLVGIICGVAASHLHAFPPAFFFIGALVVYPPLAVAWTVWQRKRNEQRSRTPHLSESEHGARLAQCVSHASASGVRPSPNAYASPATHPPEQPARAWRRAGLGVRPCLHRRCFSRRLRPGHARREEAKRGRRPEGRHRLLPEPRHQSRPRDDRQRLLLQSLRLP